MNAYDIRNTLADFGITLGSLGCVMLDVEPMTVDLPADWAYTSTDPDLKHVAGLKAAAQSHITLLFGLLENANKIRPYVDNVLEGWQPTAPKIDRIAYFPGAKGLPYACIIGKIDVTPSLLEAHARLSLLPHIDTHPDYTPHVTLGYVKSEHTHAAVQALAPLTGRELTVKGLNYGDPYRK